MGLNSRLKKNWPGAYPVPARKKTFSGRHAALQDVIDDGGSAYVVAHFMCTTVPFSDASALAMVHPGEIGCDKPCIMHFCVVCHSRFLIGDAQSAKLRQKCATRGAKNHGRSSVIENDRHGSISPALNRAVTPPDTAINPTACVVTIRGARTVSAGASGPEFWHIRGPKKKRIIDNISVESSAVRRSGAKTAPSSKGRGRLHQRHPVDAIGRRQRMCFGR